MAYLPAKFSRSFDGSVAFSNANFCALLAATTALPCTVPGTADQKFRVKFRSSYTAEIWVNYSTTATIPSGGAGTLVPYQELVPLDETRVVIGGSTLSFISAATPALSAQFILIEDNTNG